MHLVRYGADVQRECSRCHSFTPAADAAFRDEEATREPAVGRTVPPRSAISDTAAAVLSGVIVMGLGGLITGGVLGGGASTGFVIGLGVGVVAGLLVGRVIARFENVIAGALVCGILPLALCLKDAVRRGRLNLKDFNQPGSLVAVACIFGAGAVLGGLLVGVKKLIVRLSRRDP
jgi:hypothetical protein